MRTSRLLFFIIYLLLSCSLYSIPFDMILTGDPVLEDLRFLSIESGNSLLSFSPPLAPAEIGTFLDSLDISLLSVPALEAYSRIKSRIAPAAQLSFSSENFSVFFNINSTIEARVRFNPEISWYPEYKKIPSMLSVPIRFFFGGSAELYFEPALVIDPEYYGNADYFGLNIPGEFRQIDMTIPLRAFAAAGGSWWNFQLGRDRLSFGTGISGNLAVSDNPAYYEFARFSFFSEYFKYSVLVNQMPLTITADIYGKPLDNLVPDRTVHRYLYLHRLDLNLFKKITLSLTEGVMAGNSPLEIRYLNPFMVFHSMFSFWEYPQWDDQGASAGSGDMNGSLFAAELNWNIMKSLTVYGQFVMNQFATPYKLEQWPNQPPNGLGYLAGINYSHSFSGWGSVFYLEFIYTDPYLYMNPSPFASLIHMRNLGYSPDRHQYSYIGFPRDAIVCTLGARFFDRDYLILTGEFSWQSRGEHTIVWDWEKTREAWNENTPSGTAQNLFIAGLGAEWKILPYLVLKGSLSAAFAFNNNHVSGSHAAGGQVAFSAGFRY